MSNFWDPFETRGHGEFPEGTPMEMRQLGLEPGEDLFGASGFMGQLPQRLKQENGGSFKTDAVQDSQSKFVMVQEEPEEATLDISPVAPTAMTLFQPEVGEERDVITPEAREEALTPVPTVSELSHVVISAIADEGVVLTLSEGIGVFNYLNNKLGGDTTNMINWTLAYCRQIVIEATPITDVQAVWRIARVIQGFEDLVIAALEYREDQIARQEAARQEAARQETASLAAEEAARQEAARRVAEEEADSGLMFRSSGPSFDPSLDLPDLADEDTGLLLTHAGTTFDYTPSLDPDLADEDAGLSPTSAGTTPELDLGVLDEDDLMVPEGGFPGVGPGYFPGARPPPVYDQPPVVAEPETNWGLIAVAAVAAWLILK